MLYYNIYLFKVKYNYKFNKNYKKYFKKLIAQKKN